MIPQSAPSKPAHQNCRQKAPPLLSQTKGGLFTVMDQPLPIHLLIATSGCSCSILPEKDRMVSSGGQILSRLSPSPRRTRRETGGPLFFFFPDQGP